MHRWIPPTTPSFGIPKVAVVFAKLLVSGKDHGTRAFVVKICDDKEMCRGISSTRLPPRSGAAPMDFAITNFKDVHLPLNALLGGNLEKPKDLRAAWWDEIWRVPIGTLCIAAPLVQVDIYIASLPKSIKLTAF